MVLTTEWAQVEVVELVNDANGLGFNLVGGKSTGVVIKYVIPGSTADKDGRLQSGDHVLQVGSVNLRGFTSEQVATVLRQVGPEIRLLVARPGDPSLALHNQIPGTALVPTKFLSDPELLDRHLLETGYCPVYNINAYESSEIGTVDKINCDISPIVLDCPQTIITQDLKASPTIAVSVPIELPEVEILDVELSKNVYGLGITVAGYVCEKEELSGIFVKSIIEGSSADQSKQIKLNDRIIEVDGVSLKDKSNPQAVEILRNTGISVHLVLERYLRGPKYEHLQLAIFDAENPKSTTEPESTTLSWFPVPSVSVSTKIEKDIDSEIESSTTVNTSVFETDVIKETIPKESQNSYEKPSVDVEHLKKKWIQELGDDQQVIVAEVNKLGGLGISLEGTVDVEGGCEVRPHHYIRSVLPEGPIGQHGSLLAGDELLEANEHRLHGLTHAEVVNILKGLPEKVVLVCSRSSICSGPRPVINLAPDRVGFESRSILSSSINSLTEDRSNISLEANAAPPNDIPSQPLSKKSVSLEYVSDLAMWQSQEDIVELMKTEEGLGFSILDYQDPLVPQGTAIVVRGLLDKGAAQKSGLINPGDRVVSVNGVPLRNVTLDQAVQALKRAPRGMVKIGISRQKSQQSLPKYKSSTGINYK